MNKMLHAIFISLCVFLSGVTATSDVVCPPFDEKCFLNRYGHLELPRIDPVWVGHRRTVQLAADTETRTMHMVTLAMRPPLFEIADFLSSEECDHLTNLARREGLVVSKTVEDSIQSDLLSLSDDTASIFKHFDYNKDRKLDLKEMLKYLETSLDFNGDLEHMVQMYRELNMDQDDNAFINYEELQSRNITAMALFVQRIKEQAPETRSRHSNQAWINGESWRNDKILNDIQQRIHALSKLPLEMIRASEHIQVVNYGRKGHYNCHLDSEFPVADRKCCHLLDSGDDNCRICRYLTVLYFLNDVAEGGETAFPLADNSTFDDQVWIRDENNTCNLAKNCHKSNVIVKPQKGKALMWYNHEVDNKTRWMGNLDHFTFHGGCEVRSGAKWIANSWISVGNDRLEDILNWVALAQQSEVDFKNGKTQVAQKQEDKFKQRYEL